MQEDDPWKYLLSFGSGRVVFLNARLQVLDSSGDEVIFCRNRHTNFYSGE